jgi:hypothetical protein
VVGQLDGEETVAGLVSWSGGVDGLMMLEDSLRAFLAGPLAYIRADCRGFGTGKRLPLGKLLDAWVY